VNRHITDCVLPLVSPATHLPATDKTLDEGRSALAGINAAIIRLGPALTIALLIVPVAAGLVGTALPAFGYLPALGGDTVSLGPFRKLFSEPGIWQSATLSLISGLVATLLSVAIVGLFLAAASERMLTTLRSALSPILSVPHAAAAFGLAFLIAPSGLIARMISPELTGWDRPPDLAIINDPMALSLMLGLTIKEIPFLLLIAFAALPQVPARVSRQLSASFGYGRIAGFFITIWPRLYRQCRLGVFAVLAFATSVTDVALILGPQTPPTLAVQLVAWMNDPDLSFRFVAAAGALLQLCITLAAFAAWLGLEKLGAKLLQFLTLNGQRMSQDRLARWLAHAMMLVSTATIFVGIATLIIWSIAGLWQFPDALPKNFSLDGWSKALPRLQQPLWTSLICGLAVSFIATALAVLCLLREDQKMTERAISQRNRSGSAPTRLAGFVERHGLAIIYLPLLLPQAAFLFGLQFLFVSFNLDGTMLTLIAMHLVFVLPYVFLSLSDPWRTLDRRLMISAAALGRSPSAIFWRVRAPLMLSALLGAFALGFAVSAAQYLPTVLAGAGRLSTITTEAVALSSGGNRRVIGIYGTAQIALPVIAFLIATMIPAWLWRNRRGMRPA
jgi:putative thiamine transport system permease protein